MLGIGTLWHRGLQHEDTTVSELPGPALAVYRVLTCLNPDFFLLKT